MGAGCVDNARMGGAINHGNRLERRCVGQAQDRDIGVVQCFAACTGMSAHSVIQHDQREFRSVCQPLADFKPGGAFRPVDEYPQRHVLSGRHGQRVGGNPAAWPVRTDTTPAPAPCGIEQLEPRPGGKAGNCLRIKLGLKAQIDRLVGDCTDCRHGVNRHEIPRRERNMGKVATQRQGASCRARDGSGKRNRTLRHGI